MLCAACLSMFSSAEQEGTHHTCLENLQRAATGGCKICIGLALRRDELGPDPEAEATATPFLKYRWERPGQGAVLEDGSPVWEIRLDSEIHWLKWNTLPWNRVDIHVSLTNSPVPDWYLNLLEHVASDLDSQPWRVRRDLFPLRAIPSSTGHENVLDIGKMWLEDCNRLHNCDELNGPFDPEWYPKRLIDVTDATSPRLLETRLERPASRYATLSHCWGVDPDFITLKTENLVEFRQGIAIDILPKSFRDALIICKHLDIRYIWIDSLCILQDSNTDWLLHAAEMSSVYQHCYLNLSFDDAGNPSQGAFRSRNADVLQYCFAYSTIPRALGLDQLNSDNNSSGSRSDDASCTTNTDEENNGDVPVETDYIHATNPLRCLVFVPELDFYLGSIPKLPLSSRGWVVQERLLSPRVLHFTNDRIRWECGKEDSLHEGLPHGLLNTGVSFDRYAKYEFNCCAEGPFPPNQWDHFISWGKIVRLYNKCLLTYPEKDKLAALAAVAQRFAAIFGEEYYAGHFRKNMPFDLAWQRIGPLSGKSPTIRRYPTWSWTSVDAEVTAFAMHCRLDQSLVVVEGVSVILEDPSNRYGSVKKSQLELRCLVMKCELGMGSDPVYHDDIFDIRSVHLQEVVGYNSCWVQADVHVSLDAPDQAVLEDTYLIPLVERAASRTLTRAVMGIILVKEASGFYRRLGYWDTDPDNCFSLDHGAFFDCLDRNSDNHISVVIV